MHGRALVWLAVGALLALLFVIFTGWLITGRTVPEVATAAILSLIGVIVGHWLARGGDRGE